jgi:uncharacterized protein YjbI with pentapeptide repeats
MSEGVAMNIFKNDFEQRWEELFKDVRKLNEYTTTHLVELRKVEVSEQNIDGAIFIGTKFTGVKWEATRGQKSKFTKTVFRDCEFISSNFDESIFVDVEFVDCKFLDSTLSGSTMTGVRFVNCTMEETKLTGLDGTELVIEGGEYKVRTSFSFSGIPFKFKNASFSGVNFMGMVDSCPLSIEGGLLSEVDFSKSHFSTVTLRRVRQGEGGVKFNSVTAESITFEDVEMMRGTGIGYSTVGIVRIIGGKMYGPSFLDANIAKTYVRNAYVTRFAIGNKMGQAHVDNSTMHRVGLFDGFIDEFSVTNSTIDEIVGENFKADIVLWDNVTLDGKIDLTNAQVKDFRPTRLKRGPRLNLITTGSNMKF